MLHTFRFFLTFLPILFAQIGEDLMQEEESLNLPKSMWAGLGLGLGLAGLKLGLGLEKKSSSIKLLLLSL